MSDRPPTDAEIELLRTSVDCHCGPEEWEGSVMHDNGCEMVVLDRLLGEVKRMTEIEKSAMAVMDQLCSFNDPRHPEVHRRLLELQTALQPTKPT